MKQIFIAVVILSVTMLWGTMTIAALLNSVEPAGCGTLNYAGSAYRLHDGELLSFGAAQFSCHDGIMSVEAR